MKKQPIHVTPEKSPPEKAGKIFVEIMNGADDGLMVECSDFPITIGRGKENMIHLPYDHLISRHHAKIVREKGDQFLCDLRSTNGTFIGRKRVHEKTAITANELFRVGATQLVIRTGR